MRLVPKFTRRTLLKSGSMSLLGLSLGDSLLAFSGGQHRPSACRLRESSRRGAALGLLVLHGRPSYPRGNGRGSRRHEEGGNRRRRLSRSEHRDSARPGAVHERRLAATVADAFGRADELGLEIALAAGAGWCGAGGPWVKPEESMQFLVTSETRVHGPGKFNGQLPRPQPRTPFFGEETLTPELRAVWENFYIDSFVLAFPRRRMGRTLRTWPRRRCTCADLTPRKFWGHTRRCHGCGRSCRVGGAIRERGCARMRAANRKCRT